MLASILEFLFQIVLELILDVIVQILAEVGLNFLEKVIKSRTVSTILRGITYLVVGILFGILSYFVIPAHVLQNSVLRVAGIILSPIAMGLMLCAVSWFISRKDRNEPFWSTEKFIHGVIFGASYSLTRAVSIGP